MRMFIQELAHVNSSSTPVYLPFFARSSVFLPACLTVRLLKPRGCWDVTEESHTDIYGRRGKMTTVSWIYSMQVHVQRDLLLLSGKEGQAADADLKGKCFICVKGKILIKLDCFPTTVCGLLFWFICGVFYHTVIARKSQSSLAGTTCGGIYLDFKYLNLSRSCWLLSWLKDGRKNFKEKLSPLL